jgi:hypothetical protein
MRTTTARVVAALAAVLWGFFWFGVIDLLVVVIQDDRFHEHYLVESGWGLLYLVLVAVPYVVLVVRPGQPVAVAQLWVCSVAVLFGGAWAWQLPPLLNGLGLLASTALVAWLGRATVPRRRRPGPVEGVLAALSVPAAVVYGWPLARNRTLTEDITNGVSHFPMQAALGLAVAGLALLAAVTASRLPAWTVGMTVAWIGLESVVYPDLVGSLGVLGGWLAVVWAVLLVVAVERARRQHPAR